MPAIRGRSPRKPGRRSREPCSRIAGMARSYNDLRKGCLLPDPGYALRSEGSGSRSVQDETTATDGTICPLSLRERAGVRG